MKKTLTHTKVSVHLRKSDKSNRWYLYIESYPIFLGNGEKPLRLREYIKRTVTTPIWENVNKIHRHPKRDTNGIIQCKSEIDQESCRYADEVRKLRQYEYDCESLYNIPLHMKKNNESFFDFFDNLNNQLHSNSSDATITVWNRTREVLKQFLLQKQLSFAEIDIPFVEKFRSYLLKAPLGGLRHGYIARNTASIYFTVFKSVLSRAYKNGFLADDIAAKVMGIKNQETHREYLTVVELEKLSKCHCDKPVVKRAALFSALTGLRHCDIQKLKWSEIREENGKYTIYFTQQKTKGVEYMPINKTAFMLCGERDKDNKLVFEGLQDTSWIMRTINRWMKRAGISRHITFHCFRHTFATLQLTNGTDIYTVSKMLGHTNVKTTQIYAKVVDEKKQKAAEAIKLDISHMTQL